LSLFALAWLSAFFGCERASPPQRDRRAPVASVSGARAALGSRAEVVAQADALAIEGTRGGPSSLSALKRAAELRTALYRRERRDADALEALELERQVARIDGPERCPASVRRELLEGELNGDPSGTYRDLHALLGSAEGHCRTQIEAALSVLEAFRPPQAELEPRARSLAGSAAASSSVVPAASARVTRIERYAAQDAGRVVVFVSRPVAFQVATLPAAVPGAGARLFVDLSGAQYSGESSLSAGGLIERVRASEGQGTTRVVMDLAAAVEHRVFYVPEPFRLVIDVAKQSTLKPPSRDVRRVVLDPGHGGHDPGAIGPTGLREKDVALDIAHRSAPLIARELGVSTLLTRDTDVYVSLEERTARANAFGADLFISIHCNATEQGGGSGVMTFVLDEAKDALASRLAALENSASSAAGSELGAALSRVADRATAQRSSEFAELLQRAAMASLSPSYPDVPNGGVKRAGFYVLAGARMPAVLFETSFISSARDETRFNTGDFRQKLADAIVNAIRAYRSLK
jgi:N-acetylmuramoyl-L-alanine amidase